MARIFQAKIDKIYIYPFGGISKFTIPLNFSILKELIIVICGPIFQYMPYYLLMKNFPSYKDIIKTYHYSILIFNMLPIYPLDGGKILYLLLSIIIPFKRCLKTTLFIGLISIIFLLIINYPNIHLNLIITVLYLIYKIIKEYKEIEYLYNKLLLERYINDYKFKNKIIIKNHNNFYKNKTHIISENNKYYLEKEYLEKKYKKIQKNC